ncbi:liver-expressed antimicrobial peptide 2 [Anolis carolinensis]|uniref:liver-expressed antimicrobial peptide 2 n=1 Tax=Anolis carolinensis TaxID=28377 RepID=UPI0002038688|nr:PREDICTED: liver-expressed antimicrobial peptide 2 [Anolis carolinensis]|eukprot:XP_008102925.1 PREDICTED: liver-expressed antimicrobial peptide 2 [Anolis carolinensis]
MTPLKITAVILICSALLFQTQGASLYPPNSQLVRQRRMTPFWRGISRPIGASCRDNSECSTRLCRSKHCSLRTSQE